MSSALAHCGSAEHHDQQARSGGAAADGHRRQAETHRADAAADLRSAAEVDIPAR
ncbi:MULTISPECIES: hypothetical protein [unclassified Amycolatopsis]|uniref:hypothetical protein n=1 Tax=unclassified Amycolatopsis TaxID=2618356 RepID=UPI002E1E124C|nr:MULTISPECIES: hypothetical protein [unclassified Amycolatopsis]